CPKGESQCGNGRRPSQNDEKSGAPFGTPPGEGWSGDLLELAVVQLGVEAPLLEELVVGAAFHNVPLPQDQDEVCVLDGGQAVGDDEGGAVLHELVHGRLDLLL